MIDRLSDEDGELLSQFEEACTALNAYLIEAIYKRAMGDIIKQLRLG